MSSFNMVVLMGNLCRDVEMRYTPKGTAVAKISLAVNRKWRTESGEQKEEVTFVDCDAFGKTAEIAAQFCRKGSPLHVQGRLKLDQWDDKATGQKRSKLGVFVENIQLLGSKSAGESASAPATERQAAPKTDPSRPRDDDDFPPF